MIHNRLTEDIKALMDKLTFPENAKSQILLSLDAVLKDSDAANEFDVILSLYDETELCDYITMLERFKTVCERINIHEYTANMLLYLALGEKLKEWYIERGLDLEIFYASLMDLTYKLEECRLIYGIVGSFTKNWFQGFYQLKRFALGRLQFEIRQCEIDCDVNGVHIPKGEKLINMHIPRTGGRLDHDEVLKSYDLAASFFKNELGDTIIFHCNSWLLDPFHSTVLSPESNMMKFINDFVIVEKGVAKDYSSVWRLFDKMYEGDADKLPADSSLRRAYIKRIKDGEQLGWARGLFIYNK
jgi:hypothetical protein